MATPWDVASAGWAVVVLGWLLTPIIAALAPKILSYLAFDSEKKLEDLELRIIPELQKILQAVDQERMMRRGDEKRMKGDVAKLDKLAAMLRHAQEDAEDIFDDAGEKIKSRCWQRLHGTFSTCVALCKIRCVWVARIVHTKSAPLLQWARNISLPPFLQRLYGAFAACISLCKSSCVWIAVARTVHTRSSRILQWTRSISLHLFLLLRKSEEPVPVNISDVVVSESEEPVQVIIHIPASDFDPDPVTTNAGVSGDEIVPVTTGTAASDDVPILVTASARVPGDVPIPVAFTAAASNYEPDPLISSSEASNDETDPVTTNAEASGDEIVPVTTSVGPSDEDPDPVTTGDEASDDELDPVTTSDEASDDELDPVTTSDEASDDELDPVTTSDEASDHDPVRVTTPSDSSGRCHSCLCSSFDFFKNCCTSLYNWSVHVFEAAGFYRDWSYEVVGIKNCQLQLRHPLQSIAQGQTPSAPIESTSSAALCSIRAVCRVVHRQL